MRATTRSLLPLLLLIGAGCAGDDGADGEDAPPGGGVRDQLERGDALPGVALTILGVDGASGPDGRFQVGDPIAVRFRVRRADGADWDLAELDFGRAHFAGPTFNYSRVLPEVEDVLARAEPEGNGVWRYEFAKPIPAKYSPPYHDSPAFTAGELTGQKLLGGTYTLGLSVGWRFTVEGTPGVDVGEATRDVLLGGAGTITPRAVTAQGQCNRCHTDLRYHDGERRELVQCLMCHTAGAEDLNDPAVGGGTPGVTIESRVLFHRIHNAAHLPSVVGVGVQPGGELDYGAEPRPLRFATADGALVDFSWVGHPVFPERAEPAPKNFGWSGLSEPARAKETAVQTGLTACFVCHGDPDGDGPLEAPAQGDVPFKQPTRRACGACHDDVDYDLPYVTNGQTMPPQADDTQCIFCHDTLGGPLSIDGGHLHPLRDQAFDTGLVAEVLAVSEGGANDGDGSVDPGERLSLTFTLTDDAGGDVDPASLARVEALVSGPTGNAQFLLRGTLSPALLVGPQPFVIDLPELVALEYVGDSTGAGGESFSTARRPHLALPGLETMVAVRTGTGAATTLTAAAEAGTNELLVAATAGFARGDVVVVDDGAGRGLEEYLEVRGVEAGRLAFGSPDEPELKSALAHDHLAGATVTAVALAPLLAGVDYSLNPTTGTVTELTEFGAGRAVVVGYATPWLLPATTPAPPNDSGDVGEAAGEWSRKPLVPGTYAVTLAAHATKTISFAGESRAYAIAAEAARAEFLVGGATLLEPYELLEDRGACNACHQDLSFHGATYAGFDACLACHGAAGAEDLATYVAANAPPTPGTLVSLRELLHRIHRGRDLAQPHVVVGEGPAPWPDNYAMNTYDSIAFPALPGRTQQCARCHGASDAWKSPAGREHPDGQEEPTRVWRAVCAACHEDDPATAHIDSHTSSSGAESCAVCHAPGETWDVERMHHPY